MDNNSEIVIYTTKDGLSKVDVRFDSDTVWLTQDQMAELFQRDRSVISRHVKNIFDEGELAPESSGQNMHIANSDAKRFHLLMSEIQKNLTEQPTDYIAYIHSLVVILSIFLQREAIGRNIHLDPAKNNSSILAALAYIDKNLSQRITLQDAAAAAMLSPSYFSIKSSAPERAMIPFDIASM